MRKFLRPIALCILSAWGIAFSAPASSAEVTPKPRYAEGIVVYEVLAAEISAQQGDWASAAPLMLDAAVRASDATLFQRSIEMALAGRDTSSALHAARQWAQTVPDDANAHRYWLQLLIGTGRLEQSAPVLERMLQHSTEQERSAQLSLLPHYFSKVSNKSAAVAVVRQALQSSLGSPAQRAQSRSALARMHAWAGEVAPAMELLQHAHRLDPLSDEPALAVLQIGALLGPDGLALVQSRLDNQPGAALRMAWVRQLLQEQKYESAAHQLDLLTQSHPEYAEGWLLKGSLEMQNKRNVQARESLNRFLSLSASHSINQVPDEGEAATARGVVEARLLLSQLAEQNKDYALAQEHLDAIHSPEHTARILARRSSLAAAQGRTDEAMAYLRDMPTPDADALRTRYGAQLQLLRDQQRHKEAYALSQEATLALPQDPLWLYEQAMSAEKIGRAEEMEALLRALIAKHPDYHAAYNALGYSLADRNIQLDEAYSLIEKALEFAPQDAYIIDSLGWVQYRRGRLDEALNHLQRAFKAMPDAEIAAHLGEVLWVKNQRDQALAVWREGLKINAENTTLNDTIKRFKARP